MSLAVRIVLASLLYYLTAATEKALSPARFLNFGISSMAVEDVRVETKLRRVLI